MAKAKVEISCEMPWEEFRPYCDRALGVLSKDVVLKGFRPGKAPRDLLEKKLGREKILTQAVDEAVREMYLELIAQEGLEPIGPPQAEVLKLAENNPFCFKITVQVLPEVPLPDYKKLASQTVRAEVAVEDKEVEEALQWLRRSRAKFEDLSRAAEKGDFVEIEYQSAQVDSGRQVKDAFLLGEGKLIGVFEQKLEGMRAGEQKEFQEAFPDDYFRKDLAGKRADFKVKTQKVQKMELPELNDEFAQGVGKFKDIEELKRGIRQGIKEEKQTAERGRWRDEVLGRIAREVELELPDVLVASEQERLLEDLKERVKQGLGLPFEDYLKQIGKQEEDIKKNFFEQAATRVRNFLIIREIGIKEDIKVEDTEIQQAVNKFLTSIPQLSLKDLDRERLKEYNKGMLYQEKVIQKLESF